MERDVEEGPARLYTQLAGVSYRRHPTPTRNPSAPSPTPSKAWPAHCYVLAALHSQRPAAIGFVSRTKSANQTTRGVSWQGSSHRTAQIRPQLTPDCSPAITWAGPSFL
ncbi:hypothetical protein BGX38DRAFT_664544 [Terfezia claveryi]|nr:hypothetical protein BGX38DRAFT_664544 [Terfezia claveryi]